MVKYKLELKMPDSFEKGCCCDCLFAEYSEFTNEYYCIFYEDWHNCPLEKVEQEQVWIYWRI